MSINECVLVPTFVTIKNSVSHSFYNFKAEVSLLTIKLC